jgi:DNA-damage-inducible protein J
MAATTTMIHVRVDENVKAQASETLASMGLTVSDAIRVFLTRVVADQELPFALKAPNASSRVAIAESNEIIKNRPSRLLKPGMVLTIEPGLYVRPADGVPEQFHNIGIRIEDDAIVTDTGCELISRGVPAGAEMPNQMLTS